MIALAKGYEPLMMGRLLQGASGGLIGVVVPLYLAECLSASDRGKGTGIFQWLLTLGILAAALIGMYFSYRVDQVAQLGDVAKLFAFKDSAWRGIFWVSLPPGILFVIGSFMVTESPRWLYRRGKIEAARTALKLQAPEPRNRRPLNCREMETIASCREGEGCWHRKWTNYSGIVASSKIRHSFCNGLCYSGLQSSHRHQFDLSPYCATIFIQSGLD